MRRNRTTATLRLQLDVGDPRFDRTMLQLEKFGAELLELGARIEELGAALDELRKRGRK